VEALFEPSSVAVVGASRRPGKLGRVILEQLRSSFRGRVFPVNPKADSVAGLRSYPSVSSIPERVDLAVIAVPAEACPGVVEDCGAAGVEVAIVISGGFSEVGRRDLEQELVSRARRWGLRIVGPNCMGVYRPSSGLDTLFTPSDLLPRPGPGRVAILTQSGSFGGAVMAWLAAERVGLSAFVSYGNRADVDEADLLEYLAGDPETGAIAIYLEGARDGRRLASAISEVSPEKPVVVFKAGRTSSGSRAVLSHTGSLAGSDAAYEAAFKQSGAIRAMSTQQFLDFSRTLAVQGPSRGPRVGVITNGGGYGVAAVDALVERGMTVPEPGPSLRERLRSLLPPYYPVGNPQDLTGSSTADQYGAAMRAFAESGEVDGLMVIALFSVPLLDPSRTADYVLEVRREFDIPLVVVSLEVNEGAARAIESMEEGGVPVFPSPERAADALFALVRYGEVRRRAEVTRWRP